MSASFPTASGPNTPPSSLAASAFTVSSAFHPDTDEDELDSLPSESGSDSSLEADFSAFNSDEEDESDAEEEWRESMRQLELLLTMVIIPFVGKMLGRKCAYWGWAKFMEWKHPLELITDSATASSRPLGRRKTLAAL